MGLNLDVDHVAFASDRKFDGYQYRNLSPAELAQIAGRAGRATRDGTFGSTGRCEPFDEELVKRLEGHAFEPVKILQWRNSDLDFSSIGALQASLALVPEQEGLTRAPVAEDILVLEHASRDEAIRGLTRTRAAVERLWEACQVPDYRKIAPANHAELVTTLYGFLMREGKIPVDWFARQVEQADRTEGDIDTLSTRIAHVRTWTFVANRPDWLADPEHWQGVTRAVEDKLSDALHERLTARFVDRRTSVLMRRLRENTTLESEISKTGEVTVEGHVVGRLEGFRFVADSSAGGTEGKALAAAAQKALAGEIETRAQRLSQAPDDQFVLASDGTLRWIGDAVGKLTGGEDVMRPRVRILADEQLTGPSRESVQTRLDLWIKAHIEKLLGALVALGAAEDVTGIARGIAFQLIEALGVLERHRVAEEVKGLDQPARATLRKYGVRFGAYHIYVPQLLKPAPRALATQLFALKQDNPEVPGLEDIQHLAASGRTSIPVNKEIPKPLYRAAGYRVCGERAVRVDILERLADLIRPALAWRENAPGIKPPGALDGTGFTVTVGMTSLVGSSGEDFASILRALGYRMERRPKPPEPLVEATTPVEAAPAAIETADSATEPAAQTEAGGDAEGRAAESASTPAHVVDSHSLLPDVYYGSASADAPVADAPSVAADMPAAADESATAEVGAVADTVPSAPDAQVAPPPAEPEMIDVWRPGRFEGGRERHRHARGQRAHGRHSREHPAGASADANGSGQSGEAVAGGTQAPQRDKRPHRAHRPHRGDRPESQRPHHGKRGRQDERRERHERPERRERPERQPDPNSPFAKLAALKAQLESGGKEPS
jgi:ATP-dependent RNA helicase SUPV3L1/SUV3